MFHYGSRVKYAADYEDPQAPVGRVFAMLEGVVHVDFPPVGDMYEAHFGWEHDQGEPEMFVHAYTGEPLGEFQLLSEHLIESFRANLLDGDSEVDAGASMIRADAVIEWLREEVNHLEVPQGEDDE